MAQVRIDDDLTAELRDRATAEGVSLATLVNRLLREATVTPTPTAPSHASITAPRRQLPNPRRWR